MKVKRLHHRSATLYRKHEHLAYNLAKKFSEKFRRPYEELSGEATSALAEAVVIKWGKYDHRKAKPITWLYYRIYWRLMDYCLGVTRDRDTFVPLERAEEVETREGWLEGFLREVGEEGQALVRAILELGPGVSDHLESLEGVKVVVLSGRGSRVEPKTKRVLRHHLRERGWTEERFAESWSAVENTLSGVA